MLAHLATWMFDSGSKIQNSPLKITTLLSGIHTVPHYIICTFSPESSLIYERLGTDYSIYFVQFGILYSAALVFQAISLKAATSISVPSAARFQLGVNYPYGPVIFFLIFSYVALVAIYFNSMGGLLHYFNNFLIRDQLKAGMGIFDMLRFPIAYLAIMFLVVYHKATQNSSLRLIFLIILLIALTESLFGGRRNPIQFIVFGYIGILMVDAEQRLISKASVLLGTVILVLFGGLLYFRTVVTLQAATNIPVPSPSILTYVLNLSYNDIYIFVMAHFSEAGFWWGSIYGDIYLKLSSYFFQVAGPSPDEGLYIFNLYHGMLVGPPMLMDQMLHNSWPPRTFGNGYLNFGVLGVLCFFSIKGFFVGLAYKVMATSRYNPVFMYLYLHLLFSFQLSNLKIFQLITMIVALAIIWAPLTLLVRMRSR